MDKDFNFETLAIRAGHTRSHEGEHGEPIFTTSSYIFNSAEEAAARFSGDSPGNVYSRYTNPTVRIFETRIAALEGTDDAVATSSGMAAILSCLMAFLQQGDHVICSSSVFGTTTGLLKNYMAKFGVEIDFAKLTSLDSWQNLIKPNTRILMLETPSNPMAEIADIRALANLAHQHNAKLMVDNCFCTPALQQPIKFGADLIIHSATKYLDGQGRCLGGVVCGNQQDMDLVRAFLRTCGPTMSPFNAWVFLKGLETLKLRMDAHSQQALNLALWLQKQEQVEKVFYGGLPEHPGYELAKTQQSGFGGVLAFRVKGGKQQAFAFINATELMSVTANLGDVKTTLIHPATTTHSRITQEERDQTGISDNLLRVAVGLENLDDIKADVLRGLKAVSQC